jgi:hypothetical protein
VPAHEQFQLSETLFCKAPLETGYSDKDIFRIFILKALLQSDFFFLGKKRNVSWTDAASNLSEEELGISRIQL